MKVEISSKNIDLTPALTAYIEEKLGALQKFVEKLDHLEGGELRLRVTIERTTAHHHKGEVFRASANLILPRKNLYTEEVAEDAHVAIDVIRDELKAEIEKYKDK